MTRFRAAALLLTAALVFAAPAQADEAAAKISAVIENALAPALAQSAKNGEGLFIDGKPDVVPTAKGSYDVTVKNVRIQSKDNASVTIGDVKARVTPRDGNAYDFSATLPARMPYAGKDGKESGTITIGKQKLNGTWRDDLGTLTHMDADLSDLALAATGGKENMTLARFTNMLDLKEKDGLWSGGNSSTLRSFKLRTPRDEANPKGRSADISIAEISAENTYDGADLRALKSMKDEIAALGVKTPAPTEQELQAAIAKMMTSYAKVIEGIGGTLRVKDIAIAESGNETGENPVKPIDIRIASITSTSKSAGLRGEKASASLHAAMSGLAVGGLDPATAALTPTDGEIALSLDNLPVSKLTAAVAAYLAQAAATPPSAPGSPGEDKNNALIAAAFADLPKALTDAGATLTIGDTFVSAPEAKAALKGKITADDTAVRKAAGTLTLAIEGIDEMLVKQTEKAKTDPAAAQSVQRLLLLQGFGQAGKTVSGRSKRSYDFALTPDGRITLNGLDLSALAALTQMKKEQGGAAPAPSPATPKP